MVDSRDLWEEPESRTGIVCICPEYDTQGIIVQALDFTWFGMKCETGHFGSYYWVQLGEFPTHRLLLISISIHYALDLLYLSHFVDRITGAFEIRWSVYSDNR